MEPVQTKNQSLREKARGRDRLELIEDITALSGYPVEVFPVAGERDAGSVVVYLSKEDYRLYSEALNDRP